MSAHRRYRASNLFLVRLWAKETGDADLPEWRGKVQRVVNGESHQFSSLQGLVDLLQSMLTDNERRQS